MFWEQHFSEVAKNSRPSPVREIIKVLSNEGMISLAGGMPAPEVFPIDEFYEGVGILKEQGRDILQYSLTEGDKNLKAFLASWNAKRLGREVRAEEMLLTSGSQQALDLIAWSILDPGDVVIAEDPTYLAALNVFSNHQAEVVSIPMDKQGLQTDFLENKIEELLKRGKKVKLIYTIVNFQNPAGVCLSEARRAKLAQIAQKYDIVVLEDDPYGYLRYEGEHIASVYSLCNENVVYVGSFSKILSPAVRIGWVVGDEKIIRAMTIFKQSIDICSSAITQSLTYAYCQKGHLDTHLSKMLRIYKAKRDKMQECLEAYLSPLGVVWEKPLGGFFFWLDFKKLRIDTNELAQKALENQVAIIPATPFCVDPANVARFARINFSYPDEATIKEGIKRLAKTIEAYQK
ncbi:PLP-dependent aminotransferase family protein [Helicobacter sp. 11S02596-1]|uniref:aminotransferase-like domain-containing protein n=1 Tax=Helicobacter sp. 11S02596-1 TaxID=1476194 RepID=UPI000BA62592|nr:PLP-dependent aminotransferase family protein [Helicobacter sp. 11S02596-1]PAF45053.1 aminotransferase [Helicobacter sp. 11S02596-1]